MNRAPAACFAALFCLVSAIGLAQGANCSLPSSSPRGPGPKGALERRQRTLCWLVPPRGNLPGSPPAADEPPTRHRRAAAHDSLFSKRTREGFMGGEQGG